MVSVNDILRLVSKRGERTWYDFKKQWSSDKDTLLHDIICMANLVEGRDGWIIVGVDEDADYAFVDVTDDPNRKNTQNITDFLGSKDGCSQNKV